MIAILTTSLDRVLNVVADNAGGLADIAAARKVTLNAGEWCSPSAAFRPGQTPRFVDVSPKTFTAYQFLQRFTDAELLAVRSRSAFDHVTWRFLTLATAAQEVVSDDPVTVAGMDYLVSVGILTAARKAEILGT